LELRRTVRYSIKAPVMFIWQSPAGSLRGEGVTRDVSGKGAYIRTPTCPPKEVTVQMKIFLPPLGPTSKPLNVTTEGQVIRIDHPAPNEKLGGFAVLSEGFALVHFDTKARIGARQQKKDQRTAARPSVPKAVRN
jgi:hypothetical protein